MSGYIRVYEVTTLAGTINLLRDWLSTDAYSLGEYRHTECYYEAIVHYPTTEVCDGHFYGLCVHGKWKQDDRLGASPTDSAGWMKKSEHDGSAVLDAGQRFIDWCASKGAIIDEDLLRTAVHWEAKNPWWRPGKRT